MKQTLYLIYLDGYHLGDPVFLDDLARAASSMTPELPALIFFHGSGEKAERTLESAGHFIERENGVLAVETDEHRGLVERATREANKDIVSAMTDEQLSAVGIQGVDRQFFTFGEDGIEIGAAGWMDDLFNLRVIPVVSGIASDHGTVKELPPAETLLALSDHFRTNTREVHITVMAKQLPEAVSKIALEDIESSIYAEPSLIRQLQDAGNDVYMTTPANFFNRPPSMVLVSS